MTMLNRKLLRDLWRFRASAIGICIVLAVATWTFVLANGAYSSLDSTRQAYYERNQFADVFMRLNRAPESILDKVREIEGVKIADGSIQQYAMLAMPEKQSPIRALLTSLKPPDRASLNRITLLAGRMPEPARPEEAVVDRSFAEANALAPGDTVTAIVYGREIELKIVGIALSPEFIFTLGPGDFLPDEERFGIFWMGERALQAVTDRIGAINYLSVALDRNASEPQVIAQIDRLFEGYGGSGAHGRKNHLSHSFLSNELRQLRMLTAVLPPVFLGVAIFMVWVVLGRLVRTQKTEIGLLKALGYSNWTIALHYLKLAFIIALAGTLIGAVTGVATGRNLTSIYADLYSFPFLEYALPTSTFFISLGLAAAASALGALGSVRYAIRLEPAFAMAPEPPPVYGASPVEALGHRLGLKSIGLMVLRHLVRWPVRSALTVTGVALSIALTYATMQFVDSARAMIDRSFAREAQQDITVMFVEPRNEDVVRELSAMPGVLQVEPVRRTLVKLRFGAREERTILDGLEPDSQLSHRIRSDGSTLQLPAGGMLLSAHLADKLGASVGDTVRVELQGGNRTQIDVTVTRLVDELVASRAYVAKETMQQVTRDAAPAGSALVRIDPQEKSAILARLRTMPRVMGVVEAEASIGKFEELVDENILTLIRIFTLFASAVSAGIAYNAARIIFDERKREFSTLRVLGYHRLEVAMVLVGEMLLLLIVAIPLGCALGYVLGDFMTGLISSDLFRLPFTPRRATFGLAVGVCLVTTVIAILLVARRVFALATIDPALRSE